MSKYQANAGFTSKHGHKYKKGMIIGALRYRMLHPSDQKYFDRLVETEETVIHHTTHHVIYDDSPFYDPVPSYPIMPVMAEVDPIIIAETPAWATPEPDFGGGSGGGAGAGGSWDGGPVLDQQEIDAVETAIQDPQFDTNQVNDTPNSDVDGDTGSDNQGDDNPGYDDNSSSSDDSYSSDSGGGDSGGGGDN